MAGDCTDWCCGKAKKDAEKLFQLLAQTLIHYDSVCLSVFLPNLEVTIVSTALFDIANDLGGFADSGWIMIAYLTTYTGKTSRPKTQCSNQNCTDQNLGLIVIWAKLSDIVGRKFALGVSLAIFTAFSAGCGAAQTMTQVYVSQFCAYDSFTDSLT
jgi:MFS family permease